MNRVLKKAALPLLFFIAVSFFVFNSPILAFFMYVPFFFVLQRKSFVKSVVFGALYGLFSYMFHLSWLFNFNQTAFFCLCFFYFFYFAIIFLAGHFIFKIYGNFAAFAYVPVFCAFEFLRTLGFLGFSYGIASYSLWNCPLLIQSSSVFGIWGIEFLLVLSSAFLYFCLKNIFEKTFFENKKYILIFFIFILCLFFGNLIFGFHKLYDFFGHEQNGIKRTLKICAVQNNSDPWKGDFEHYSSDIENLLLLTEKAISENQNIDFVVWPETAVVPSIIYNYYDGKDENRHELVKKILNFIDSKNCVFILGNYNPVGMEDNQKDFNSAFVFVPKKNVIPPEPFVYSKVHLVPFAEYFPYDKQFPFINDFLFENDRQWSEGGQRIVFFENKVPFSVPICFEDGFGGECAEFVQNGARLLFNISNDAWANSRKCQIQHLSMSVFRSVENRIPVIRSTASGETCYISCDGIVKKTIPPFSKNYLIADVDVFLDNFKMSFYSKYPDIFAYVCVFVSICLFLGCFIFSLLKKSR